MSSLLVAILAASSCASVSSPVEMAASPLPTPESTAGPLGASVAAGFRPESVSFRTGNTGYALGTVPCGHIARCQAVVRTRDAGRTWKQIHSPTGHVTQLRFATPYDGWAYGRTLFSTHDGGATWVAVPGASSVTSLEVSPDAAWRVDRAGVSMTDVTRDAWRLVTPQRGPLVVGDEHAYLLGSQLTVLDAAPIARRQMPCPTLAAAASGPDVALACARGAGVALVVSHDAGASWSPPQAVPGGHATAVAAQTGGVYVATAQRLLLTSDGGAGWTEVLTSRPSSLTTGGSTTVACITGGQLLISTDRGRHWKAAAFR